MNAASINKLITSAACAFLLFLTAACGDTTTSDNGDVSSSETDTTSTTTETTWQTIFTDTFNRADAMLHNDGIYSGSTTTPGINLYIKNQVVTGISTTPWTTSSATLAQTFNAYPTIRIRAQVSFESDNTAAGFIVTSGSTTYWGGFQQGGIYLVKGTNTVALSYANMSGANPYIIELTSTAGGSIVLKAYDASGASLLSSLTYNDTAIAHTTIGMFLTNSDTAVYPELDNLLVQRAQ